jgi:hypothetical protein
LEITAHACKLIMQARNAEVDRGGTVGPVTHSWSIGKEKIRGSSSEKLEMLREYKDFLRRTFSGLFATQLGPGPFDPRTLQNFLR